MIIKNAPNIVGAYAKQYPGIVVL